MIRPFVLNTARPLSQLLIGLCCLIASGQAQAACKIQFAAEGVKVTTGMVAFVVFQSKEGWPFATEKALKIVAVPAKSKTVEVSLDDLPAGRYAIAISHDENGNKRLDKKPSGRPKEGYGVSNNPKIKLKAPSFQEALVETGCNSRVVIQMIYPPAKDAEDSR